MGRASSPVHRLAPFLRGHRREPGADAGRGQLDRHTPGFLPCGRHLSACARRAQGSPSRHRDPGLSAHRRCGDRPRRSGRPRRCRRDPFGPNHPAVHRFRRAVRLRVQPRAAWRKAAWRLLVRALLGCVPCPDRLFRADRSSVDWRDRRRRRGACSLIRPAQLEHSGASVAAAQQIRDRNCDFERWVGG